jgi:hypothetical protein
MSGWTALLGLAGVTAGALLLFSTVNGAPAAEYPKPPQRALSAHSPSDMHEAAVRVEHDLIVVQPPAVRPARPPAQAPSRRAVTAQRATPAPSRTEEAPRGIASRAGRILVGDGRHRPEPFPRVDTGN